MKPHTLYDIDAVSEKGKGIKKPYEDQKSPSIPRDEEKSLRKSIIILPAGSKLAVAAQVRAGNSIRFQRFNFSLSCRKGPTK